MGYHRDNLFRAVFLQEGVEQGDTAGFSKAAEIGIGMGRTAEEEKDDGQVTFGYEEVKKFDS